MAWSVAPVLGVRNVAAAVEYYSERLGFDCPGGIFYGASETEEGGVYALMVRDGTELHLQIRRQESLPGARERIATDVYFHVEDVDALLAEFESNKAMIFRGISDGVGYDLRDFVVEDIDGHRLAFGAPQKPSSE